MNIFYLSKNWKRAAGMHCDKHVCKMLIEYAQLMSTAHRVIDGTQYYSKTKNGHKIQRWLHPDPKLERELYKASHINHPSNIWIRENEEHYTWLFLMFSELSKEYTKRYSKKTLIKNFGGEFKVHKTWEKLGKILGFPPKNIAQKKWEDPPQCMPDSCKTDDVVEAYRQYYIKEKSNFAVWKYSGTPKWYTKGTDALL
jgi:hypothetical protein